MKKEKIRKMILVIIVTLMLAGLAYRVTYDYACNKTIEEYLDSKDM